MAALSLGSGYPTVASVPHSVLNGFKNMVAACCESGYEFKEATALLNAAKSAPTAGAANGTASAKVEDIKEEKEEVEDVGAGNLFGGDDDGY